MDNLNKQLKIYHRKEKDPNTRDKILVIRRICAVKKQCTIRIDTQMLKLVQVGSNRPTYRTQRMTITLSHTSGKSINHKKNAENICIC